jgi:hypothetical protein
MFTHRDLRALLDARPFIPFRLYLSDGGSVDVLSREVVIVGNRFAVVGILDPSTHGQPVDRYVTIWYLHVARHEMLSAGAPPLPPSDGPAPAPTPA